jgi:hypothetical protein
LDKKAAQKVSMVKEGRPLPFAAYSHSLHSFL